MIDYVGGLDDLRAGVVRSIGDPEIRFREDPVRMLRAVALAARLDFAIEPRDPRSDPPASPRNRAAARRRGCSRSTTRSFAPGYAEKTFRGLAERGAAGADFRELHRGADDALWRSLAARRRLPQPFASTPDTLTNAVLLGSLLVPLGLSPHAGRPPAGPADQGRPARRAGPGLARSRSRGGTSSGSGRCWACNAG